MRVRLSLLALVALLLVGCIDYGHREFPTIPCEVEPDEVFGRHYTAADFQIWQIDEHIFRNLSVTAEDSAARLDLFHAVYADNHNGKALGRYSWIAVDTINYQMVCLEGNSPIIDGSSIAQASVKEEWGQRVVAFEFAKEHHAKWLNITSENVGHHLAIMLGDRLLCVPEVVSEIANGKCSVNTGLQEDEQCALSLILNKNVENK
jgi:hypothetical protein